MLNKDLWCRNEDAVFGAIDFSKQKVSGKTEIFVQHFIDLLEDKIVPWRLEEVGFVNVFYNNDYTDYMLKKNKADVSVCIYFDGTFEIVIGIEEEIRMNITTFTDLLTLIRFLK